MIAPSATMIEAAQDQLKDDEYIKAHLWVWAQQDKEVLSAIPNGSPEFMNGYRLGLQTARVLLAGMPEAVENKVEI